MLGSLEFFVSNRVGTLICKIETCFFLHMVFVRKRHVTCYCDFVTCNGLLSNAVNVGDVPSHNRSISQ